MYAETARELGLSPKVPVKQHAFVCRILRKNIRHCLFIRDRKKITLTSAKSYVVEVYGHTLNILGTAGLRLKTNS